MTKYNRFLYRKGRQMKLFKKMITFVLVAIMTVAMGATSVFAEGANSGPDTVPTSGTGTITVNNAAKGETYKAYKILDAEVGANGAIVYKGEIPDDLASYFTKNDAGEITLADNVAQDALFAALKTYVNGKGADKEITAESSTVVFANLDFGYYVITSTQGGGAAISVTSTKPDGVVNEKNVTTPKPEKTVDGESYSIGDTITYTVTFNGANYRGSDKDARIVTSYDVTDTLPAFLTNATVTSVKIGETETITDLDVSGFATNKKFNIPWATWNATAEKWESLYNNGTLVTIVYTAKLTDVVRVGFNNTNTVTVSPNVGKNDGKEEPTEESWSDDAEVKTYATAIKKVDKDGKPLAGAKFKVQGLTATGEDGVYTVTAYKPTGVGAITLENSTELEVDANGMLYIVGLKDALTLSLTETKAPKGYNKLNAPVQVTSQLQSTETYKKTGYRKYDAKGNIIEEVEQETAEYTEVVKNLSELDAKAVQVENQKGTELPSTGGIGTTIFYVLGGLLAVGAGIVLVARRKASE